MTSINFRTDDEVDQALAELLGPEPSPGKQSRVIREAILAHARERRAERLRQEAEALAANPDDRAEARAVLNDMEPLRAW